ncbi:hypothetical protein [Streptomyces sp. NPDC001070]
MITPIEGRDEERDPALATLLQPGAVLLGPPPGRFREVRRAAARRRLLRAAAGAGVSLAVAAVVALPLQLLPVPGSRPAISPPAPAVTVPPAADPTSPPPPTASPTPTPQPTETPGPRHSTGAPAVGPEARRRTASSAGQSRSVPPTPIRSVTSEPTARPRR